MPKTEVLKHKPLQHDHGSIWHYTFWTTFLRPPQGRKQKESLPQLPLRLGQMPGTPAPSIRNAHDRAGFGNEPWGETGLGWGPGSAGESGQWQSSRLSGAVAVAGLNSRPETAPGLEAVVSSESKVWQQHELLAPSAPVTGSSRRFPSGQFWAWFPNVPA